MSVRLIGLCLALFCASANVASAGETKDLYDRVAKLSCDDVYRMVRTGVADGLSPDELHLLRLVQTYAIVTRCALNERTKDDVRVGQLRGMVDALDDPHSALLEPEANTAFQDALSGEFFGIGAELEPIVSGGKFRGVRIVAPIPDTPAERAGVKAKDVILAVDGKKISTYKNFSEVVKDIKGPKGTSVSLTLAREGASAPLTVTITRDKIVSTYVKSERLPNNWGWIKLTQFQGYKKFCPNIKAQLEEMESKQPLKGVVLDMRNNPGGLLSLATCATSLFAPESLRGKVMLYTESRDGVSPIEVFSGPMNIQKGKPLIVLVNQGSASASEILAKVCQSHGYCVVAGETSFGKGTIQQVFPIAEGKMSVKVTFAQYLVSHPSGALLAVQGVGVIPNVILKKKQEEGEKIPEGMNIREADLGGSVSTSKVGTNVPTVDLRESDPELLKRVLEALSAPQLKLEVQ